MTKFNVHTHVKVSAFVHMGNVAGDCGKHDRTGRVQRRRRQVLDRAGPLQLTGERRREDLQVFDIAMF